MLLQLRAQQQAAAYANAVVATSNASTQPPTNAVAATTSSAGATSTAPATAMANASTSNNGASSGPEISGSDAINSQSPTVLAAMAAAQRNQALQQEQLQRQISAAVMVSANVSFLASSDDSDFNCFLDQNLNPH